MRLSRKAMSFVSALLWGASILVVCLLHLAVPTYGTGFLEGISSVYPGFHGAKSLADSLLGTGYAIADGGFRLCKQSARPATLPRGSPYLTAVEVSRSYSLRRVVLFGGWCNHRSSNHGFRLAIRARSFPAVFANIA